MPNNAIVGGSADIAVGSALYKRINGQRASSSRTSATPPWAAGRYGKPCPSPRWTNIGSSGARTRAARPHPLQLLQQLLRHGRPDRWRDHGLQDPGAIGAGVNPEQMHAERVDGYNPLAVADAIERKKKILLEGRGPVLLDSSRTAIGPFPFGCVELPHQGRGRAVAGASTPQDLRRAPCSRQVASKAELDAIASSRSRKARRGSSGSRRTRPCPRVDGAFIGDGRCSPTATSRGSTRRGRGARSRRPARERTRSGSPTIPRKALAHGRCLAADGKPLPKNQLFRCRDALFEAMLHRFSIDPTMAALGEENRDWGGAFAVYRGLTERFPTTGSSTARSPRAPSSARRWATRSRAAAPCPSSCTATSWAGRATRFQPGLQMAGDVGGRARRCPSCCASRWATSTAPSTARTGPPSWRTCPGLKAMFPVTPTMPRACSISRCAGPTR